MRRRTGCVSDLAIAHVLDRMSRTDAARCCGMDRQTLRDWVHLHNAEGIAGARRCAARRPTSAGLDREQMAELRASSAGPDPARHGVVRWRCVDLCAQFAERVEVDLLVRTGGQLLHRMGLSRGKPRPLNPPRDLDAQATFKLRLACSRGATAARGRQADRDMVSGRSPCRSAGNAELHLGRTRLTPGGGARRSARCHGCSERFCPERAVGAALVMPWVSSEVMSVHLTEISKVVGPTSHCVLICDGAGWHPVR